MKYIMIPFLILADKNLNSTEKIIMGIIYSLSIKSKECFAANNYFSNKLGFSTRTVSSAISTLKKNNFIITKNVDGNRKIYLTEKFKNMIEE